MLLHFLIDKANIVARVSSSSVAKAKDKIKLFLDINKVHYFDKETKKTIIEFDEKGQKIKENTKKAIS